MPNAKNEQAIDSILRAKPEETKRYDISVNCQVSL